MWITTFFAVGAIVVVCCTAACCADQLTSAGLKRANCGEIGRGGRGAIVGTRNGSVDRRLTSLLTTVFILAAVVFVVLFNNSIGSLDWVGRMGTFFCGIGCLTVDSGVSMESNASRACRACSSEAVLSVGLMISVVEISCGCRLAVAFV